MSCGNPPQLTVVCPPSEDRTINHKPFRYTATSIFPSKEALRDLDRRQQILEQATDEQIAFLASLDDALYALLESPKQSPDVFVGPYIEAHPEEFFRG